MFGSLPSPALKAAVDSEALSTAATQLSSLILLPEDAALVERVAQKARHRVEQKNAAYADLVCPPFGLSLNIAHMLRQ